jgi:hypothetical protein
MVLFFKMTNADLYDVSRLVLSPIVTRPVALQLHNNNTEFVWGGWLPTNYQVNSQLGLRLSWAVTTKGYCQSDDPPQHLQEYPKLCLFFTGALTSISMSKKTPTLYTCIPTPEFPNMCINDSHW